MPHVHDGATLRTALAEIAGDFSYTWTPGARALFEELAPRRFYALGHNPTALLSELTDEDLAQALTGDYADRLSRVLERLAAERESETWWQTPRRARRPARRLLLHRVRPRREPADLLRRPRHPRRRPSQGGLRARRPARRRRPQLPARLLPAAAGGGRPPGRAVSPQRHEPAAADARADGSGGGACGRERRARSDPARRLARRRRPRAALSPRHEGRGQPRLGARRDRHALRRRSREPAAPGARARRRRRPRAAPARPRADGVPHERGALGVSPGRAAA